MKLILLLFSICIIYDLSAGVILLINKEKVLNNNKFIQKRFDQIIELIAKEMGADAVVDIKNIYYFNKDLNMEYHDITEKVNAMISAIDSRFTNHNEAA